MWRVVLVVFGLAAYAQANRMLIEDQGCTITEVLERTSGSLTYYYPRIGGSPGTVNCTVAEMVRCNQTVPNFRLSGRSWFISQDKAYFGMGYNPRFFQTYNVQCPEGHYLSISFQDTTSLSCIVGRDTVNVITSRGETTPLCTDGEIDGSYLSGRGVILQDATARIDFCSNDNDNIGQGFVIRATCFNPHLSYNAPGCVSYDFFRAWDPEFVDSIEQFFDVVPTRLTPHKRSAEERASSFDAISQKVQEFKEAEKNMEEQHVLGELDNQRSKRGQDRYFFTFENGTQIIYSNNMLSFLFLNGTVRNITVYCLSAYNADYGTRVYRRSATRQIGDTTGATLITFTGPGFVDISPNSDRTSIDGILNFTPPQPFETFLENEGIIQHSIASRIYDYISTQWVKPYPVVDDIWAMNLDLPVIPLTGPEGRFFPREVRPCSQVGVVFPDIEDGSVCRKVVLPAIAPLRTAAIDPDILRFCSFFQYACEPILSTACREIMLLDPFDVDPSVQMMMMGGGD